MRLTSYLITTTLLVGFSLSTYGCGSSSQSKSKKDRLTKKTYAARVNRCRKQLQAAHLAAIARWMKEKAETKKLAAGVDKMLTGKKTRPLFLKFSAEIINVYLKLIDKYPSEEAFQKAVQEGPRKEVALCFTKKACGPFAKCASKATTLPILTAGGGDKMLRKWVSKPSLRDQLMAVDTLKAAVRLVRPVMTDENSKLSKGAALLAVWSAKIGLKVGAIKALPASNYKSVMKDPDEERGRHICTRGRLIQIQAEKTANGKLYHGGMFMGWGYSKVGRFIAAGSTRGINQGSRARFCGVVIGRYSYPNSAGGTTHAVQLIGVFDIADNR